MYAIDTTGPTREDVHSALLWAVENDRVALIAHREVMQYRRRQEAHLHADRCLVRRWRESVVELNEPSMA